MSFSIYGIPILVLLGLATAGGLVSLVSLFFFGKWKPNYRSLVVMFGTMAAGNLAVHFGLLDFIQAVASIRADHERTFLISAVPLIGAAVAQLLVALIRQPNGAD